MLEKEFVPYEQALELKELGFDEPCFGYYINESKELILTSEKDINYLAGTSSKTFILAPTFSQAFRWFREKYGLIHCIQMSGIKSISYDIRKLTEHHYKTIEFDFCSLDGSNTYEKAELACLRKLIEIVKN